MKPPRPGILGLSALTLLCLCSDAQAYFDPGSTAILWQILLSAAVGVFFLFRQMREKARAALGWIRKIFRNAGRASRS